MINSISLHLTQNIGKLTSAKAMWEAIFKDTEGKTLLYQVDAQQHLQELKCAEGKDLKAHLTDMTRLCEELAGMGASISDDDFTTMIIGSLLTSY
jgi:hypothetical protein